MNKQLEMEKFIPKMSPEEFGQFVKEQFAIARPVIYYKKMVDGVGSDPVSTKIASEPWQLGHGEWVCKVEGVTGCVALSHLRFVEDTQGGTEMTALEFELKALESGLKIGWKLDFRWVESMDDRKCCLLISPKAAEFAVKNNIETEKDSNGYSLCYFPY